MPDACCIADFHLEPRYAAFRGALADAHDHAHLASQWMASLTAEPIVLLGPGGQRFEGACLLVPGNTRHRVISDAPAVTIWLDPTAIRRQPDLGATTNPCVMEPSAAQHSALAAVVAATPGPAFRLAAERLVATLIGDGGGSADPVVAEAIAALTANPVDPPTIATLARGIGLPVRALRTRFVAATGTSLRAYRLWARLVVGIQAIAAGANITAAAHEAGFADGAHFSRTFSRQFGLAPANAAPLIQSRAT